MTGKRILLTGSAGFIGSSLVTRLVRKGVVETIVGLDNLNDYYDTGLKRYRLDKIRKTAEERKPDCLGGDAPRYVFVQGSILDCDLLEKLFDEYRFDLVVHLASQPGVRYSIDHPEVTFENNLVGFFRILEVCRKYRVGHLVFASSSSVYGKDTEIPFAVGNEKNHPVSPYAATKACDELLAYAYSKTYQIPVTGLRFFTVYGPAGRPDMFYYSAAEKLSAGKKIRVYNHGDSLRDFTYIDDAVEAVLRVLRSVPKTETGSDGLPEAPYEVYNVGGGRPMNLMDFLKILHEELIRVGMLPEGDDLQPHLEITTMQPGDVPVTFADVTELRKKTGFAPETDLRLGLRAFCEWYKTYTKCHFDRY